VQNEDQVKDNLQNLRKKYHDARHFVYAFMIGEDSNFFRASDDGEPSNSSGMPVLGQIRSFQLTNILIVVVRYFGGTKLGVPGLINAYKTAAFEALNCAEIIEKTIDNHFEMEFTYDEMNFVMRVIKDENAEINSQEFVDACSIKASIRKSKSDEFLAKIVQNHKIKIKQI
jgi:uncharacterized YigZ family protein